MNRTWLAGLWCSFEAAVVQVRKIAVARADERLTTLQWRQKRWGSFGYLFPWERGDGVVDELYRANADYYAFATFLLSILPYYAFCFIYGSAQELNSFSKRGIAAAALVLVGASTLLNSSLWLLGRSGPSQGPQCRLAINGQTVLRIMDQGNDDTARVTASEMMVSLNDLLPGLPWLPCAQREPSPHSRAQNPLSLENPLSSARFSRPCAR